jgi:hypothetical protein
MPFTPHFRLFLKDLSSISQPVEGSHRICPHNAAIP